MVFVFSEVPETGSKEWALSEFVGFAISLRGLCNLLIIECMNKFEHNIQFVTKTLTFEGLWFSCFRRSQRQGPKNGPSPSLLDLREQEV